VATSRPAGLTTSAFTAAPSSGSDRLAVARMTTCRCRATRSYAPQTFWWRAMRSHSQETCRRRENRSHVQQASRRRAMRSHSQQTCRRRENRSHVQQASRRREKSHVQQTCRPRENRSRVQQICRPREKRSHVQQICRRREKRSHVPGIRRQHAPGPVALMISRNPRLGLGPGGCLVPTGFPARHPRWDCRSICR